MALRLREFHARGLPIPVLLVVAAGLLLSCALFWAMYQFGEINSSIQTLNKRVSGLTEENVRLRQWMAQQPRALQTINPLTNTEISALPLPSRAESRTVPSGKPTIPTEESVNAEREIAKARLESMQEGSRQMVVQTDVVPFVGNDRPAGPLNDMIRKARTGQ